MLRYVPYIPPAQKMSPIGKKEWFATAQIKQLGTVYDNHCVRLPGEWHGATKAEAEAKARRAAEEWIAKRG